VEIGLLTPPFGLSVCVVKSTLNARLAWVQFQNSEATYPSGEIAAFAVCGATVANALPVPQTLQRMLDSTESDSFLFEPYLPVAQAFPAQSVEQRTLVGVEA